MARNTVKFIISAVNKTGRAFGAVSRSLGTITKRTAQMGAAFAALGIAAGVTIVRSQMKSIDVLGKTAQKIGATTEALGKMRFAAEITGVSTETMDMALQRFVRRTSEATRGTGEAVGALHELGLNAEHLVQLPLDVQMGLVGDAMGNLGGSADRVRVAMKLFDSEGVSLVNTLQGGSAAISKMSEDAEKLGILMSDLEVKQVMDANDELLMAFKIFDAIAQKFTVAISPYVAEIANMMRQAALDTGDFADIGERAALALVDGIGTVIDAIHVMRINLLRLSIGWDVFATAASLSLSVVLNPLASMIEGLGIVGRILGMDVPKGGIQTQFERNTEEIKRTQEELARLLAMDPASEGLGRILNQIILGGRKRFEELGKDSDDSTGTVIKNIKTLSFLENQQQKGREARAKWETLTQTERTASVIGNMNTLFSKNKAFQIAQAIMQTYQGATLALSSYPPPLNFAMAAATIAAGLQQVAAIKSQSFLGGGFTGHGARSGGVDGRGGFLGVLHPNESIIDHARGGAGAIIINNTVDASGADPMVDQKIRVAMQEASMQTIAAIGDLRRRGRGP